LRNSQQRKCSNILGKCIQVEDSSTGTHFLADNLTGFVFRSPKAKLGKTAGCFNILWREREKEKRKERSQAQQDILIKPALLHQHTSRSHTYVKSITGMPIPYRTRPITIPVPDNSTHTDTEIKCIHCLQVPVLLLPPFMYRYGKCFGARKHSISVADLDDFYPDPDTTFQIVKIRFQVLPFINYVQTFPTRIFFAQK
jgi:hypothetical protein